MKPLVLAMGLLSVLWPLTSRLRGQTEPDGAPPAGDPRVTCAIVADQTIDRRKSPIVSVIEQRLVEKGRLRLLERDRIDALLGEQEAQALLGADAGPRRS